LERAIVGFERSGIRLHAEAVRFGLGECIGGQRGTATRAEAESSMRALGVVQPVK
jgi:hypothetical protein